MAAAIAEALAEIAAATRVDGCQLLEFTESGAVARVHVRRPAPATPPDGTQPPAPEDWLVERLRRGEIVVDLAARGAAARGDRQPRAGAPVAARIRSSACRRRSAGRWSARW